MSASETGEGQGDRYPFIAQGSLLSDTKWIILSRTKVTTNSETGGAEEPAQGPGACLSDINGDNPAG